MKKLLFTLTLALSAGCHINAHNLHQMTGEQVAALVLLGEARDQGEEGMRAVGQVILNRSREQNKTVKEICLAGAQFSCVETVSRKAHAIMGESELITNRAEAIAAFICHGIDVMPELKANHYYNPSLCNPRWAQGVEGVTIGDHLFLEL